MVGSELSTAQLIASRHNSLLNQLANHGNEGGMNTDRWRTCHRHSKFVADLLGLFIEIEQDFHVV